MLAMDKQQVGHEDANPVTQMIWANTLLTLFLAVPSLTVMVLLRGKLGYRTLKPWMILAGAFVLFMLGGASIFSPFSGIPGIGAGALPLFVFALLVAGSGFYQRYQAWGRIQNGERWHTKSRGVSHLAAFFPWSEHLTQRFIEPVACLIAGILCASIISIPLGLWIAFSGGCLLWIEAIVYDLQLNRMLDQLDGLVEAEIAAENDAYFSQSGSAPVPFNAHNIQEMAGITVGFSPDLQRQIAQRRAAKAAREAARRTPDSSQPPPSPKSAPPPRPAPSAAAPPKPPAPDTAEFCFTCGARIPRGTEHRCPKQRPAATPPPPPAYQPPPAAPTAFDHPEWPTSII